METNVIDLTEFENSVKAQGGKIVKGGFSGGNRDRSTPLEKGDEFIIPADYKVFELPIANTKNTWQFTRVSVTNNGVTSMKNIGASVFNRRIRITTEEGDPTSDFLEASGTVHDEFIKHGKINDAFKAIANQPMVVTDVTTNYTRSFTPGEASRTSTVYQIDFKKA